jgi:riboflavin kinase / FMN adenylyltransferase
MLDFTGVAKHLRAQYRERHDFLTIETPMPPKDFRVVRDSAPDAALRGAVVAIGNFDGVHRGHKAVISAAQKRAMELGRPAAVLTFEPHPRLRLLAATGLDGAIILTFDAALAKLTAEEFVERILVERFGVSGAVIGFNFYFGARRGGSPDFLVAQGKKHGFTVDIVPPLRDGERPVSSGPIREALEAGQLDKAAEFLGFPWFVSGEVIHGDKRGRELGFPTANVALDPGCRLRHGIYAVRVAVDGKRYDAVASFGRRPTFDNGPVLLEIFLFDFSGDLYGKTIDVAFIEWIRDEKAFASAADLVRQMQEDSRLAREALARAGDVFPPI